MAKNPKENLAKLYSAALVGIYAERIEVEVDTARGLSSFTIVGLGDKAIKESRERIMSAIKNSGMSPPNKQNRRVTVNLAPADVPKAGSAYDLAIAVGYLLASEQMKQFLACQKILVGELALDGGIRPIPGALSIAKRAKELGIHEVILPEKNAYEAAIISGVRIIPVTSLQSVIDHLENTSPITPAPKTNVASLVRAQAETLCIEDVRGQESAKRALEIAAAGGHNILLFGSPGVGKTLLAKAFRSILPPMSEDEIIETTEIFSAAGLSRNRSGAIVTERPFRAPHHSASLVSVVGGGTIPRPGEISLAHHGVLFFDELPEFKRDVLEALRQPLEDGMVTIARAKQSLTLPARFIFIASMNPCPCGYYQDPDKECTCSAMEVLKYQKKMSGPLMDRIDIHISLPRISYEKIVRAPEKTAGRKETEIIQSRIHTAREAQKNRLRKFKKTTNSQIESKEASAAIITSAEAEALMKKAMETNTISVRGFYKILKIARTIADIESSEIVDKNHIAEALQYRARVNV